MKIPVVKPSATMTHVTPQTHKEESQGVPEKLALSSLADKKREEGASQALLSKAKGM